MYPIPAAVRLRRQFSLPPPWTSTSSCSRTYGANWRLSRNLWYPARWEERRMRRRHADRYFSAFLLRMPGPQREEQVMFSPLRKVKPNAFHLNHSSSHLVLVTCLKLWRADGRGIPPTPFNESSYRFKSHDPTNPPATRSPFLCLASRHVVRCSPDTTAVAPSSSSSAFVSVSQPIRSRSRTLSSLAPPLGAFYVSA